MEKVIIFDLDGTSINSLGDIHVALNKVLAMRGATPLNLATVRGFIGKGSANLVTRALKAQKLPDDANSCAAGLSEFFHHTTCGDQLSSCKPNPKILYRAMAALGTDSCLFVGDSEVDRHTATAACQPFALFNKGYRKTSIEGLSHEYYFEEFCFLPVIAEAAFYA